MGDGGVACVPLQPIMEKFPGSETFGGGGGGGGSSSNGKMESNGNSKVFKRRTTKRMKLKRDAFFKKEENQEQKPQQKTELVTEKVKSSGEVENGKEEVEEGELGTLRSPPKREVENGEVTPETASKNEVERGEIVSDKWRREEVVGVERYDFGGGRFRGDHYVQRRERTPEKYRRGEYEKTDFGGTWRGSKDEVEKGEFIPDRWQKGGGDGFREEYGYLKGRRHDSSKERERRYDWTPPRYSSEDVSPGREYSRIGTGNHRHCKRTARWEVSQERSYAKGSMKNVDELAYKNDYSYGRSSQGREQHPTSHGSRLKRYGTESEGSDRKPYDDHGEYVSSKSRRLSNSEHYSRQSGDKPFRSVNSSRSLSDRLSVRHYDDAATRAAAYDRQRRSPSYSDRSPHERGRQQDHRDRTPARHERSPVYRSYRHDSRNRSPSYVEKSPNDRVKAHERRERSPSHSGSSVDRSRQCNHRQTNRNEVSEIKHHDKIKEEKLSVKESTVPSKDPLNVHEMQNGAVDKGISHEIHAKDESQGACLEGEEQPSLVNGVVEELPSMEEDMDICDTPPHIPCVANANLGKWYYIDHFGEERGPSRLCDLKALIDGGILMSDHLVKHSDSDRWVTVENAASPVVAANFTTVFSEAVTQLVSPPEAPGNVLMEAGDIEHCVDEVCRESIDAFGQGGTGLDDCLPRDDLDIDDRVGALLDGVTVLPGKELEIVGEVLQMTFDQSGWERFGISEGILQDYSFSQGPFEQSQQGDLSKFPDTSLKDAAESTSTASVDKECSYLFSEFTEWFSDRWSCKGGDWQRNEEAVQDKHFRKKLVLNDGYPLCQMPKIGCEDPRWQRKDDLYYPSQSKKLDLPPWAFSWPDERIDSSVVNKMGQAKPVALRGIKGSMMPVIRINACVVKDQGSSVSDSRLKPRVKEKYPSKGTKHYSLSNDVKKSSEENVIHSKSFNEEILDGSLKSGIFSKPKDRLWTVNDMQLQLGEWYYLDGTGHEHGPFSSSALPKLVEEGFLKKQSSVFRKMDSIWVPVTSVIKASEKDCRFVGDNNVVVGESSEASSVLSGCSSISGSFHSLHPHFIGYTLGKLHELVMKSYKSREFAAAVNEVLDPWINSRQTRKEMEKHRSSLYLQKLPMDYGVSVFENDMHGKKRCWTLLDGVDEDDEMAEGLPPLYVEPSFEDLCGNVSFCKKESHCSGTELQSWGLLDGHILARIFHFLRTDVKSLVFASSTCKHWRTAVGFYKNISVRIDLSTMGSVCTDSVIGSILGGYNKQMIKVLTLDGCINVTSAVLEGILQSFSHISSIDIRGCSQFEELMIKYPHVNWVKGRTSQGMRTLEDSNAKLRSLKQMPAQSSSFSKLGHVSCMDESSGLKDYFDMVEKRGAANQAFRQNLYKRTKVVDARKSSVLARDARMRHLAMKKAGNGYRRMEEFLVLSLQDIMKGNISDYFVRKVAEIENKIKSGYYARRGLSSAKQDIIKMCREAIKMKKRGDGGDMEHVIPLFIKLGTRLDESFKIAIDRDEMKKQRDEASGSSGYRKFKTPSDRKYTSRTSNGGFDYLESSPDRDVKKNLTRINKKTDLDSESSDEFELSSDDDVSGSGSASDTESDSDVRSGVTFEPKEEYFTAEEAFDLTPEDREWGARMTKASLVPPVTRKYEVIDQYVIVADEAEVQRKMQVSLPEDYEDKVKAQKNGSEEVDMEIPEVKEYKPRKQLGQEVIEQEVYGIDPYTHNLLLDSMRDDVDWTLAEKHVFIEDTILRVLNKQVRSYTGSGNTPMKYPLKPVIEELLGIAKQDNNMRTWKLCEGLLHAIDGRPEDNYVAYRKGLGVVCDKEAGFTEDDFVVEFLGEVYPAWKWFEKQDGIRCLQKNSKEPAPEFYNIYLERPKGDADGYDLVVVDAMHKANYASRICHSCRPNCEAKVTAVSGQYQIGIYSVRPIGFGEEITFDYNSVTESKEEYEASVCLCGSQVCRGSYLNLTGEGAFQKVLKEWHGLLDKHRLLLESCELNWVSEEDYIELGKAGLGSCLLGGLPDWLIAYSARLVRFINFERTKLPEEILSHNLEEKKKYCADISLEMERSDAEIQAEGVYNQRLQNLALTLDKVRYVLRNVFGDPKEAPPPLQKLSPEEMVSVLWNGEDSLVDQLLQCIAQHVDDQTLQELKYEIRAHDPSTSGNVEKSLRKSLLWLRDEVRNLPCTYKSRHDAAADLIHIYAYTKSYFKIREYKSLTSPPVHISPHDLGPKCADKLAGVTEYCKTYGENYCLGQLIYWHNQANTDPDRVLVRASKGCLSLPDIGSFYAKAQKPSRQRIYGPRTVRFMLARMEKQPQRPWPKDRIWSFSSSPKIFGSPMLDAVLNNTTLEREMVIWLKNRPAIFQAMWDR